VVEAVVRSSVAFDEEAANRAVADLAATTDGQLIVDILAGLEAVITAWRGWRADPPQGQADVQQDELDQLVASAEHAAWALPADATVRDFQLVAAPILGAFFLEHPQRSAAVSDAVERLRWLAISRPGLVDDARRLKAREDPAQGRP
jgi:hypothetical protein